MLVREAKVQKDRADTVINIFKQFNKDKGVLIVSNLKYKTGAIIKNRKEQEFIIVEVDRRGKYPTYLVQSVTTGYEVWISRSAIYSGKYLDKLVSYNKHGGAMGYASSRDNKVEYNIWEGMLTRCNNPEADSYKYYGGRGVTVCDRWHRLDHFIEDLPKVEGYNKELLYSGEIQLDKDIKGMKEYSLEGCVFLPIYLNKNYTSRNKLFKYTSPEGEIGYHINKKELGKKIVVDDSSIGKVLRGERKTAKGYRFEYIDANDYQKGEIPSRVGFVRTE